ncbi:hypothetical protein [Marinilabilia sp.]|uniref:hypothetical protein n=1 Tax=Marinilabilia sp. TaxID=2021252 RepID=UPI0025C2047E|nr:hypothetical protein [Marinilabilia sp.]
MKRRYGSLLIFIAVTVLVFALGILFLQVFLRGSVTSYIENLLEKKIGSELNQSTGDSLVVNIQKLEFNGFPLTVSTPDISIYAETGVDNADSSAMLYTKVYEAGIINLEISLKPLVLIALGQKKFNVNCFQADSVYFRTKHLSEEPGVVSNTLQEFQIGPIRFKGKIELPDDKGNGNESLTFERHSFQAANLYAYLPQNLKSFYIDSISFDGTRENLRMEKIVMLPIYPKEEFFRHVEFETDRIETHLDNIDVNGFRTYKKDGRRGVIVSRVNISKGVIDIFRDRRPPFNEEQRPAMPVRLILSAPIDLYFAEINISETDILYSEFPENGSESGFPEATGNVTFNRLKVTVKNISNIADSLQNDSTMQIKAEAFVFDDALLQADFRYNLKDINGGYTADVKLSEFRFEIINPAIYPLAGIKIAEGIHSSSVFSFTGNDVASRGELYMGWNGLLLDLTPEAGDFISGLSKSFGKIVYHPSSPNNENNEPSGEIFFERDIKRFVFHYWWNCYLSGIKKSVLRDFVSS